MVTCNLTLGRLNEEDCEFKTTLENLVRPRLKKTKLNQTKQKKIQKKVNNKRMWSIESQNGAVLFNTFGLFVYTGGLSSGVVVLSQVCGRLLNSLASIPQT